MASKVLVKMPTVHIPQGRKPPLDLMTLPAERNESVNPIRHQGVNVDRVAQLEQNMQFLQEQHQATLVALHQEVEALRQKNRDLQFQLVFSKRSTSVPSSPSSPEDSETGFAKTKGSPVCVNVTPLQVELLEKDLQDVKTFLQEAKTENQYLSEIIEQQKKKLDLSAEQKDKVVTADVGIQVGGRLDPVRVDLAAFAKIAEAMQKQWQRQKEDQRKEIATWKAALPIRSGSSRGGRSRDSNNGHHSRVSPTGSTAEQASQKFPPLQSQSYWHRRGPRNGRNRQDRQDHHPESESPALPILQNGSTKPDPANYSYPVYRPRGYSYYYREDSNCKYRGQMSQRERRDPDHHHPHPHPHPRREYKDRHQKDQKDHQSGDVVDSTEESRDAENSAGSKS